MACQIVQAGPLRATLEGIDLRCVSWDGIELVRRLYAAVRDTAWGTVPPQITELELELKEQEFRLRFDASHRRGELHFAWRGRIEGTADGTIRYGLDGGAENDFLHNRIGLCALLPPETWVGRPLHLAGPSGRAAGELPRLIAPQLTENGLEQPVLGPFEALGVELADARRFDLRCQGDLFEIEDQRNWSDASFKVYSTPLALGYPRRLQVGERVVQAIDLCPRDVSTRSPRAAGRVRRSSATAPVALRSDGPLASPPPSLGTATGPNPWPEGATERLRGMGLSHLRIGVDAGRPEAPARLVSALRNAESIDAGLELALSVDFGKREPLRRLLAAIPGDRLSRILVFAAGTVELTPGESTPASLAAEVRELAREAGIAVPVGGGSALGFNELNRTRPPPGSLEAIAFPICPTVHADDQRSIVETLSAQPEMLASARAFAGGAPIAVGPIALGADPRNPDPRQQTPFAGAWTLGSAVALALGGAAAATFFEAVGPAGLLTADARPTPAHASLAALADWSQASVLPLRCERPFTATGLLLRFGARERLLLANLTAETLAVQVAGLPADSALGPARRLELEPYAVVREDV